MTGLLRSIRRRLRAGRPFPAEWLPVLEQKVPFYRRLAGKLRLRFLDLVKLFAWEKCFIGAGGMEITDEVRVLVSACAVRLILYGALNEAEFFAVATEAYFERPRLMKALAPDLYAGLQAFYGGDPANEPNFRITEGVLEGL